MAALRWLLLAVAALLAGCGPGSGKPCGLADEPEPNDTRDTPAMLALATARAACAASETDEDWYQVAAPAGAPGHFTVDVSKVGSGTVTLAVFAASDNGEVFTSQSTDVGRSFRVFFSVRGGSAFRLRATGVPADAELPAFGYTVTAAFAAVTDALEPNDTRDAATALTLGTPVTGSFLAGFAAGAPLPAAATHDWFKVTLAAGQKLSVALENVATDVEPTVTVLAPDASEWATESRSTPGQSLLWTSTDPIPTAGTWWLDVAPSAAAEEAGDGALPDHFSRAYTLTVRQVP